MKPRNLLLVGLLMILSGWVGMWIGEQRLKFSFANWKPAVIVNKSPVPGAASEGDFTQFWTVWEKLNQNYVDKTKLDTKKMIDGAISGMVGAVGDPYTSYLPFKENKESKEDLGGAFEGVGIQLGYKEGQLSVVSPIEGSPAGKAGVMPGDLILRIKDVKKDIDRSTDGIALPEAVTLIRGDKGTKVTLTMFREGKDKPFEVELKRDTIVVKSVTMEEIEKDGKKYAWIKLNRFGDRTQEEWGEAITKAEGIPIVLDLRNNPGGYLDGAVYIAGEFLTAGKLVVAQQYGDGTKTENKVQRNGRALKSPLVVIVNKGSASASEILAGALQDYKRAKVVGVQSFGKGSVQQPEDFPDGSGIHITVAKWLRPSGEWIDKIGIKPDVEVKWEENLDTGGDWTRDPQLSKAVELL